MAVTGMLTTNALRRQVWATEDWVNPGAQTVFGHFFSRGAVHYVDAFKGQPGLARGDQITYDYTGKLTGLPIGEGGTLDGNEEALNIGNFTMAMNVMRIGVLNPNSDTIEQQRTLVEFPERTRKTIPNRLMELLDTAIFYQAAGSAPTSFTLNGTTWAGANQNFVFGFNTPTAPTTNRIVRAGGVANDQSLTGSNTMTLDLIDFAMEKMLASDQPMQALSDGTYDLFVSPYQWTDLKQDTSGKIQWYNNSLSMAAGGKFGPLEGDNMYNELPTMGRYANVNIHMANRVAYGLRSDTSAVITTVQRAVLVGKDAITFASPWGGRPTDDEVPLKYFEQLKDYTYFKGLEGRFLGGIKKTAASNSEDIGTMVISTYGAAHA